MIPREISKHTISFPNGYKTFDISFTVHIPVYKSVPDGCMPILSDLYPQKKP